MYKKHNAITPQSVQAFHEKHKFQLVSQTENGMFFFKCFHFLLVREKKSEIKPKLIRFET